MTDGLNRRQRSIVNYFQEKRERRIKQLELEIIMGRYYDGWTLRGMKVELEELKKY